MKGRTNCKSGAESVQTPAFSAIFGERGIDAYGYSTRRKGAPRLLQLFLCQNEVRSRLSVSNFKFICQGICNKKDKINGAVRYEGKSSCAACAACDEGKTESSKKARLNRFQRL